MLRNYNLLNIQRIDPTSRAKKERFSSVSKILDIDERQAKPEKESRLKDLDLTLEIGNPVRIRMKYNFITILQLPGRNADRLFSSVNHKQTLPS